MPLALGLVVALALSTIAQSPNPSIRGVVVDARTNTPIADARVTLVEAKQTTKTGPDGRFEFANVPARTYALTVSTIGYIFVRRRVETPLNTVIELTVPLAEGTGTYQEEVTVSADAMSRPKALGVSSQMELGSAGLAELRGVAADDPMRAIQALPGVATGDDFRAEFSVRGSAFRHTGIVMDGIPTSLLMHTLRSANDSGSIAMVNSDILSRAALFGGPHARSHGDWLGATLEFDVREGSRDRAALRTAVSGTAASGVFEGPLGTTRRGSWLVSIRRSYIDWLVRKLEPEVDSTIGFTDAQSKVVYDLTSRHQVQFFLIAGDATYTDQQVGRTNGIHNARSRSSMATLSWRYARPRAVLTQRLALATGTYQNRGLLGQHLTDGTNRTMHWRADVTAPMSRHWMFDAGIHHESGRTAETVRNFVASGPFSVRVRAERATSANTAVSSAWTQMAWRGDRGGVAVGFRAADMSTGQGVVLPWLLVERTWRQTTVRAGIGRSAQFIDPIVNALAPSPLAPEQASSYDVSVEQPLRAGWRVQGTVFYRDESNIVRRSGEERIDPVSGTFIPESMFPIFANTLEGTSKGLDALLIRRSAAGLNGWIGYSWAHTRYQDRATGETFDGDFDQRHTLNVFLQQRLSYRLALSGKLRLGSNFPIVGYFAGTPDLLLRGSVRNQIRLPFYSRLDLRLNRSFTFERSRLTLFAEVMNALGRRNGGQADDQVERLLPRVPSAGFLFEF